MPEEDVTDFSVFARVWPSVSGFLLSLLRRRGMSSEAAEDVTQEVAARSLARIADGRGFDSPSGLLRWSCIVATRVATDAWRYDSRPQMEAPPPSPDPAEVVSWKLTFSDLGDALGRLSPEERRVLVERIETTSSGERMRRKRARAKMKRWIGGLPAGWRLRLRRLWGAVSQPGWAVFVGCVVVGLAGPGSREITTQQVVATHPGGAPTTGREQASALLPRPVQIGLAVEADQGPVRTRHAPGAVKRPLVVAETVPTRLEVGTTSNSPDKPLLCVTVEDHGACVPKPASLLSEATPGRAGPPA